MKRVMIFASVLLVAQSVWAQESSPRVESARQANLEQATLNGIVKAWPECDEYMPKSPCKVTVNMSNQVVKPETEQFELAPQSHFDVQVNPFVRLKQQPAGEAAVFLTRSSPFLACTVSSTPAAPARDLSTNVGTMLTAIAGIGAVPLGLETLSNSRGLTPESVLPPPTMGTTKSVHEALAAIHNEVTGIETNLGIAGRKIVDSYDDFRRAIKQNWKFTFASNDEAQLAVQHLKKAIDAASTQLELLPDIDAQVAQLDADTARFERELLPRATDDQATSYRQEQTRIFHLKSKIAIVKQQIGDLSDRRKLMLQVRDYLQGLNDSSTYTEQALRMPYYSGKTVTETVTCKDVITKDSALPNVIFTAYYETLPLLDISVGAIGSLLGGRQVGSLSAPYSQQNAAMCAAAAAAAPSGSTAPACGPSTLLGYTTRSSYQFMPGVFIEARLKNARCPWAKNGDPWHPIGYVCSFGIAGGVAINPNNGGPAAEFFEGLSFGIQRFAILAGVHNGRYQQFGGGYYAGESFPPGTTITAPTVYGWATHPAFGIAYRIPLR